MTDRVNSLLVILEKDVRDDDVVSLMESIRHFRNVLQVRHNVSDITTSVVTARAQQAYRDALMKVLED